MVKVSANDYKIQKIRRAMKESGLDPDPLTDSEVVDYALTVAELYFAGDFEEDDEE
ncbi:hypothetical protein [Methanooceanicella nereidis]|uniref:hypothetical protein n=1 Tax=Methanooceanicella nereidis TaxID=2052831 RepID=UPI001E3446FB|nr:hypothetical protein [Methanocella sp. CWC-04]